MKFLERGHLARRQADETSTIHFLLMITPATGSGLGLAIVQSIVPAHGG